MIYKSYKQKPTPTTQCARLSDKGKPPRHADQLGRDNKRNINMYAKRVWALFCLPSACGSQCSVKIGVSVCRVFFFGKQHMFVHLIRGFIKCWDIICILKCNLVVYKKKKMFTTVQYLFVKIRKVRHARYIIRTKVNNRTNGLRHYRFNKDILYAPMEGRGRKAHAICC